MIITVCDRDFSVVEVRSYGEQKSSFYTTIDGNTIKLKTAYTDEFLEDLKGLCGLSPDEELARITEAELTAELFYIVCGKIMEGNK